MKDSPYKVGSLIFFMKEGKNLSCAKGRFFLITRVEESIFEKSVCLYTIPRVLDSSSFMVINENPSSKLIRIVG
jgi:hypothetical protein